MMLWFMPFWQRRRYPLKRCLPHLSARWAPLSETGGMTPTQLDTEREGKPRSSFYHNIGFSFPLVFKSSICIRSSAFWSKNHHHYMTSSQGLSLNMQPIWNLFDLWHSEAFALIKEKKPLKPKQQSQQMPTERVSLAALLVLASKFWRGWEWNL